MARGARIAVALLLILSLWGSTEAMRPRNLRRPRFSRQAQRGSFSKRQGREGGLGLQDSESYEWEERWYEQTLDHFSARTATFQQKYLFAPQWWTGPGAPIFMYCGNEGDIEKFAENSGFMWDIAPQFGALLLFPEHRYYGESMPFGSQEAAYKDAESLAYLNTEQALADFVVFITDLKRNLSAEASPVVLFGGSYGGMLAAWFRLKYPHIVIGAVASSAPILQFEDIVSPYTFYDTVSRDFRLASETCYQTIKKSWNILDGVGASKPGLRNLTEQFGICKELESSDNLVEWIDSAYDYVAMVNYPYPASFLQVLPGYPITEMCKAIDEVGGGSNGLEGIAAAMNVYYNYSGKVSCFDLEENSDGLGVDGWDWQACTEMVMPMSCRASTTMFPAYEWTVEDFAYWCNREFGVKPKPHWAVEEYGGQHIHSVLKNFGSNIVFSNGLMDPWSGGGVLEGISESIVALTTEKGAHHLDLRAASPEDPDWLVEQRAAEVAHIQKWLAEYYLDKGRWQE